MMDSFATSDATRKLERALPGRVMLPGSERYDAARALVMPQLDPRPRAIVRPSTAAEVAKAVTLLASEGEKFAVRGGGHSPAGFGGGDGAFVLDMRDMTELQVDPKSMTASAGAGLTAAAYTAATQAHGLATGFGDTGTVGITGLTLGGGLGFLSRKHGLTIDDLLGAEVVTADGEVLWADDDAHPDLFWALRGGGGNFGVVTRLRYRLHEVATVYGGTLLLPATAAVLDDLVSAALEAPDEFTVLFQVMRAPPLPFVPPEAHGRPVVAVRGCHVGTSEDGEAAFAKLRASATPLLDAVGPVPYPSLLEGPPGPMEPAAFATTFRDTWGLEAAESVMQHVEEQATTMRAVQLRVLGGAITRVARGETAYPHRDRSILVGLMAGFGSSNERPAADGWLERARSALGEGEGAFLSLDGSSGLEAVRASYPFDIWERLRRVKRAYDPGNVFSSNHNVPPAAA